MLRPSYLELIDVLNQESELNDKITSNYAVVIAAAKRARQLVNGAVPLAEAPTDKAVSVSVCEIYAHKIKVLPESLPERPEPVTEVVADSYHPDNAGYDEPSEEPDESDDFDDELMLDFDDDAFDEELIAESSSEESDDYDNDYED